MHFGNAASLTPFLHVNTGVLFLFLVPTVERKSIWVDVMVCLERCEILVGREVRGWFPFA